SKPSLDVLQGLLRADVLERGEVGRQANEVGGELAELLAVEPDDLAELTERRRGSDCVLRREPDSGGRTLGPLLDVVRDEFADDLLQRGRVRLGLGRTG